MMGSMDITTVTIQATITANTESYEVFQDGKCLGYAARNRTGREFSLTTAAGIDLVAAPLDLAPAIDYLVAAQITDCPCCDGAYAGMEH